MNVTAYIKQLREAMDYMEMDQGFINRSLNQGFSGGEKKRMEVLQMLMLKPSLAILDETDSGLDIDALKVVAKGVNRLKGPDFGALIITHYQRILTQIVPDFVHIMYKGRIVTSGGKELVETLETRARELQQHIFSGLTPWQKVQLARHPARPYTLDYISRLFTDFTEVHGDRRFADDAAMIGGIGFFEGVPILCLGQQKGRTTKEKLARNLGMAKPEGYRKAMRLMDLAARFGAAALLILPAVSAFYTLNFTGCTTYTSLSGVRKEMRLGLPVMGISLALGVLALLAGRFL